MQIKTKKSLKKISRSVSQKLSRYGLIKLDKNERLTDFTETFMETLKSNVSSETLSAYPDQNEFLDTLQEFLGVSRESLLVTSGADAGIKYIFESVIDSNDEVLVLDPTYAMAEIHARTQGAIIKKVPVTIGKPPSLNSISNALTSKTKIVYLANPNQPTGCSMVRKELVGLIELLKKHDVILIIDEAYIEFSSQPSSVDLIDKFENIVVVRTLSKAFGLAGLRIGYIVSNQYFIDEIKKVQPLCDVNSIALIAGNLLLKNYDIVLRYAQDVTNAKTYLEYELGKRKFSVFSSDTNFIHFLPKADTTLLWEFLLKEGVLVRTQNDGLPATIPGMLRITVGSTELMEIFLHKLDRVSESIVQVSDPVKQEKC